MPVSEVWALERIDGNYVMEGALLQSGVQEEAACWSEKPSPRNLDTPAPKWT